MENNIEKMMEELKPLLKEYGYSEESINELEKAYFNKNIIDEYYYYDGVKFKLNLSFVNESNNPDPQFNKNGDAGFDLRADISSEEDTYYDDDGDLAINIQPNELRMVGTKLYFAIPDAYEMQIRPRSGLVAKHKVTVANSPGTVDSNYRGEIKILLHNFDINNTAKIRHGDRIAQAVINNIFSENQLYFNKKNSLDETNRGSSGFGDSGYK